MERIPLEKAYELPTTNFLNDLAYLKDKARHDEEEHKKWLRTRKGKGIY